jgi:NAD(P)-dependent dehydrogenase (short-subunit alcohol dehydrogenase family)
MLQIAARLSTSGGEFATVAISAGSRPALVEYPVEQLEAAVGRSDALIGKLVLVTGSSRGLGSQISLGSCLHGADVILHGRGERELNKVAASVRALGRSCTVVQGDLNAAETWTQLAAAVRAHGAKLDVFVNNAFGAVIPLDWSELTDEVVEARILRSIASTISAVRQFLPLMSAGGSVVNVSTDYTQEPTPGFSYYVVAKSATEGLFRALAVEYPNLRFVTARPPRLHTDMTNDLIVDRRGAAPQLVAAAILRAVEAEGSVSNHIIIDATEAVGARSHA